MGDLENWGMEAQGAARAADAASKSIRGLSADSQKLDRIFGAVQGLTAKVEGGFKKLGDSVKNLGSQFSNLSGTLDGLKNKVFAVFGGATLIKSVSDYSKGLFDLGRVAQSTGRSFGEMKNALDTMNRSTALSRQEALNFFREVESGTNGIRMMSGDIADLAKTLHDEFGPSLEDASKAFKDLAAIQKHDIFLMDRLKEGIPTDEMNAYASSLLLTGRVSREQMQTLIRTNAARETGVKTITKEEERNRQYVQTIEELEKAFQNLVLAVGKPLADVFAQLTPYLTNLATWLTETIEKSKGITSAIGGIGKAAVYGAGIAIAVKGVGMVVGMIGGLINVIRSLFGKAIQPVTVTNWPPGMMGGGGPGGMAGGVGKWGRFARFGAAGAIVGIGGQLLGGAIAGDSEKGSTRSRIGAGVSGVSAVGSGALTGAAIGSVIPGVGTAIGAVAGGLIGLVTSLDDFKEALNSTTKSMPPERAYKDFNAFLKQEDEGLRKITGQKAGEKLDVRTLERQFEYVRAGQKMGEGQTFKSMTTSLLPKESIAEIIKMMQQVTELQQQGINIDDKTQAIQGVIEQNLAKSIVTEEAIRQGLTGSERERFIETQSKSILGGRFFSSMGKEFVDELEKRGSRFRQAEAAAGTSGGLRALGAEGTDIVTGGERAVASASGRRAEYYAQLGAVSEQLIGDLKAQVALEDQAADFALKYYLNIEESTAAIHRSQGLIEQQIQIQQRLVNTNAEVIRDKLIAYKTDLKSAKTEDDRLSIMSKMNMMLKGQKDLEGKLLTMKAEHLNKDMKLVEQYDQRMQLQEAESGLLEAQLGLVDSLYAGMGPRVALRNGSSRCPARRADAKVRRAEQDARAASENGQGATRQRSVSFGSPEEDTYDPDCADKEHPETGRSGQGSS
jgi:hypothetical protein